MKKIISLMPLAFILTLLSNGAVPYKAGDYVEDFSLKNIDGKMVSLSQIGNAKGFIVVFMCNTCPVVKKYEQRIIDLNKEFSGKGYPVVAINSNDKGVSPGDSYEDMQKTARSKGYDFLYLYDESQQVAKRFGATNTPHVYVLTKDGDKLQVRYVGAIDNNADDPASANKKYVEDAVNDLLKGQQIAVTGTRAVGCGIKWKKS